MAQIITIGEILVEVMAHKVGQRFDETGTFIGPFPSGASAIFADQAALCGSPTAIISAVGDDGFGAMNLRRLKDNGVDISKVRVLSDTTTGVAFVTYKPDGSRDSLFHIANTACGHINEQFVHKDDFRNCAYFHVMGSSLYSEGMYRSILKGMEYARQQGSAISFDPNVRKKIQHHDPIRQRMIDILNQAQIVLADEHELFYLTGVDDEADNVTNLLAKNAQIVIIKRGARGATMYIGGQVIHSHMHPVEEIDPTGAGDCFGGTFISCLNQGFSASDSFHLAAIAGAKAVTKRGPMEGNSALPELQATLASIR